MVSGTDETIRTAVETRNRSAGTASRVIGKMRTDTGISKSIERTKYDAVGI